MIRVVQWTTGIVGRAAVRAIAAHPGMELVGCFAWSEDKVGRDVGFAELAREWGFTSVVLANGAWRDRPLPIDGIDDYVGKGLVYQNPFIIWFNHNYEPGYSGETFETPDGAIVVGGGLASIDVVKVIMLENAVKKLAERGIEADLVELEVKGIPKILKQHDLEMSDLGLEGPATHVVRKAGAADAVDAAGLEGTLDVPVEARRLVLEVAAALAAFEDQLLVVGLAVA